MFEWLTGRNKKKLVEQVSFSKRDISPLLPLESRFATAVKTHAYLDTETLETKWLVAKCKNKVWDVLVYTRKQSVEEGDFTLTAEVERQNRGVTYAHVLCRLAEFERIRKNVSTIVRNNEVDQKTTAPHFVLVANHDGVGIDTEGQPQMSDKGEFVSGSFSEQQSDAVYKFHSAPELKPIEDKSAVAESFEESADVDMVHVLHNIEAIAELDKIKAIRNFLEYSCYKQMVNEGWNKELYYGPQWSLSYSIDWNKNVTMHALPGNYEKEYEKAKQNLKECPHLSETLRLRVEQALIQIPVIMWGASLALFKNGRNDVTYQEQSESGGKYTNIWWSSTKEKAKEAFLEFISGNFIASIRAADKRLSKDQAKKTAENFETVSRQTDFFKAEMIKIKDLIDAMNAEIEKLTPKVQQQINRSTVVIVDPKTHERRVLTLK